MLRPSRRRARVLETHKHKEREKENLLLRPRRRRGVVAMLLGRRLRRVKEEGDCQPARWAGQEGGEREGSGSGGSNIGFASRSKYSMRSNLGALLRISRTYRTG